MRRKTTRTVPIGGVLLAIALFVLGLARPAFPQANAAPPKAAPTASSHLRTTGATNSTVSPAFGPPVKTYGSKNAPITMEVFTDYQCPSCRNLFEQTLRPLINEYVASGKVYLIHHDFPLPMHRYGYEAARWANAAARVGQFANVEAALYDNQDAWGSDGNIAKYVEAAVPAADYKRIEKLMQGCEDRSTPTSAAQAPGCALDPFIEQDRAIGLQIPVQSTPTYIISRRGQKLPAGTGVVSWPILKQFFDSLLSS